MLRTFALLAFGVALIAWGTNYMVSQGSTSRADMLEDLASGLMGAVDSVLPEDDPTPLPIVEERLAISGTGGSGVALRDDCADDARSGGSLPEGAEVTRISEGAARCEGWSVVRHLTADSDIETWVRDDYLQPSAAAAP